MVVVIYALCALTALGCSWLLARAYRRTRTALLFWSSLCFAGFTLSNVLVVVDEVAFPMRDWSPWRVSIGVVSVAILIYGLVYEERTP